MTTQFRRYEEHHINDHQKIYTVEHSFELFGFGTGAELPTRNELLTTVGDHHIGIIEEKGVLRCNDCDQTISIDESSTTVVKYVLGRFLHSSCVV